MYGRKRLSFICVKDSTATFIRLSFVGASVCCGSYMVVRNLYGIYGTHVQYPYQSIRQEQFAIAIVALTMTCLSSLAWAGPVKDFNRYSPAAVHIRIVGRTLGIFVAYGIAAWMCSGFASWSGSLLSGVQLADVRIPCESCCDFRHLVCVGRSNHDISPPRALNNWVLTN